MKTWQSIILVALLNLGLISCGGSSNNNDEETTVPNSAFTLQLLHFADIDDGRDIINNAPRFSAILLTVSY